MKFITEKGKYVSEFNKFNMYFIKDVKNNKDILEVKTDGKQITFLDGTIYTFKPKENSIYRNKVKICNNIANCTFSVSDTNPEETGGITKKIAIVNMLIKGTKDLKSTNEYVLRYW